MRDRKAQFDISNKIDLLNVDSVSGAVIDILKNTGGSKTRVSVLKQAFDDCFTLFNGDYPGYLPCDTLYHDQQHTFDMTLALARLIDGHDRSQPKEKQIGPERAMVAIITALFHDSGYIRREADHMHHNGAEYTRIHVSRSAEFLKRYFHKIGAGEYAHVSAQMVHYTGYEVAPDAIRLPDEPMHIAGHMLGTADLVAQMSDRCYLEKCRDRLYPEFVLGGIAVQQDDKGREVVLYSSGEDLLRKTPAFYAHEVENRLNRLFNEVYKYETVHFDGKRRYIESLGQNQQHLKRVLEKGDFGLLRRIPPENYGTRNFPGLDAYLDEHPLKLHQVG